MIFREVITVFVTPKQPQNVDFFAIYDVIIMTSSILWRNKRNGILRARGIHVATKPKESAAIRKEVIGHLVDKLNGPLQ